MNNRIASLFELDDLLQAPATGHATGAARRTPRPSRQSRPAAPASKPAARATGRTPVAPAVTSLHHDTGAPVRCAHDVAYPPVARVDVPPTPGAAPAPTAQQFSTDQYDVEAFEDPASESDDMELPIEDSPPEEPQQVTSAAAWFAPRPRATASSFDQPASTPTFAAQMSAVEHDLADLAARATTPDGSTPPAPAGEAARDDADRHAPAETAPRAAGHALFDQMAAGMGYATEFRLPPVQLSQVFSALDRQLDAESREVTPVAPAPTATAPSHAPPVTHEMLLRDLVAIPDPRTDTAARAVNDASHE